MVSNDKRERILAGWSRGNWKATKKASKKEHRSFTRVKAHEGVEREEDDEDDGGDLMSDIIKEVKNVKPWRIAYAKDVMRFVERKSRW